MIRILPCLVCLAVSFAALEASARQVFFDDFNTSPSPLWGAEVGTWSVGGGEYSNSSFVVFTISYSSLPFNLRDFTLEMDIRDIKDGGAWLRSQDPENGVLLVTGGHGGTGNTLYWHIVVNGDSGPILNESAPLLVSGVTDATIRVEVSGDEFRAYFGDSMVPATILTTPMYPSGRVAVYDNADPAHAFQRVVLSVPDEPVPFIGPGGLLVLFIAIAIVAIRTFTIVNSPRC